jgi:cytoskeletal protein RodZ
MVSVRALLVPAVIALAWLVWNAGSAQASTDPSKAAVFESALDPSLVNAPTSPAAQHVATAADAVVGTTAPAVSTVTRVTEPVALPVAARSWPTPWLDHPSPSANLPEPHNVLEEHA